MTFYFFEFPKTGLGVSGGERCMLENALFFSKKGMNCVILTTDNGKIAYENFGLVSGEKVRYITIKSFFHEKRLHVFFSYLIRTVQSLFLIKRIDIRDGDVLICNSDFFPNSIPFFLVAYRHKKVKIVYWWRVMAPDIFKGFEGQFSGKIQIPKFNIIHYRFNQLIYRLLMLRRGIILTPAKFYQEKLSKMFSKNRVYAIEHYGGFSDLEKYSLDKSILKKYDLVWMGRFQKLKGIDHFISMVKKIKESRNNISAIIVGTGSDHENMEVERQIEKSNLLDNITMVGFVSGTEKYKYIQSSKIFVSTSCFESYGQVNLEGMICGLPVVAYNLPTFDVFKKGMLKIPIFNDEYFVECILKLLDDKDYYEIKRREAINFAADFSWEKTGEEILGFIS